MKFALLVCSWTSLATRRAAFVTARSSVPSNRLICSCRRICSAPGATGVCAASIAGDVSTGIVIIATAIARFTAHLASTSFCTRFSPARSCFKRCTISFVRLLEFWRRVMPLIDGGQVEPPLRVDLVHQFGEASRHLALLTRLALADDVAHALQQFRIGHVGGRRRILHGDDCDDADCSSDRGDADRAPAPAPSSPPASRLAWLFGA